MDPNDPKCITKHQYGLCYSYSRLNMFKHMSNSFNIFKTIYICYCVPWGKNIYMEYICLNHFKHVSTILLSVFIRFHMVCLWSSLCVLYRMVLQGGSVYGCTFLQYPSIAINILQSPSVSFRSLEIPLHPVNGQPCHVEPFCRGPPIPSSQGRATWFCSERLLQVRPWKLAWWWLCGRE